MAQDELGINVYFLSDLIPTAFIWEKKNVKGLKAEPINAVSNLQ